MKKVSFQLNWMGKVVKNLNFNYTHTIKRTSIICTLFLSFTSCNNKDNRETDADIIFENLMQSFEDSGYPEYYGGSYIRNQALFIFVSNNNPQIRKDLVKRGKGSNFAYGSYKCI